MNFDIISKNLDAYIRNAKAFGLSKELDTACNNKCYLIKNSDTEYLLCIPDDVTCVGNILKSEFNNWGCKVKNIIVIGGNNITDASHMFSGCMVESIDLKHFKTSNITNMRHMFSFCRGIQSLDLSSFDTSNVTDMNCMFSGCGSIRNIDLSSFNTSNVTDMSYMFNSFGCVLFGKYPFEEQYPLKNLDLSSFNTSKVTNMTNMFKNCRSQLIDISTFKFVSAEMRKGMFEKCISYIKTDNLEAIHALIRYKQYKNKDRLIISENISEILV